MPTTSEHRIWLDAPNVGALEKAYLARTIDSGFVSTVGPFVPEFEQAMATRLGAAGAVATQSGTAALHVALHELGIGAGDEVILPVLTFVASANPVRYMGARPVFVDVDRATWNLSVEACERAITPRTRAIMAVHLLGNPAPMDGLLELARAHGLHVIEDATESLGATLNGQHMGTLGDFGCLSFNGNKTITTGGGGMVLGRDGGILKHVKFMVNQARDESRGYYHPEVGFNYRMTNLEAALGLAQLERLDDFLARKRRFREIYAAELGDFQMQREVDGATSSWWLNAVLLDADLPRLQERLRERGIQTRRLFVPITDFPPYAECGFGPCPVARELYERALCLPSSTLNGDDDILQVCAALSALR